MQWSSKTFGEKNTYSLFYLIICIKFFNPKVFKFHSHSKCANLSCTPCIRKTRAKSIAKPDNSSQPKLTIGTPLDRGTSAVALAAVMRTCTQNASTELRSQ